MSAPTVKARTFTASVDPTAAPGDPTDPQPCAMGPEPATHSLIYQNGDAYVPVCDEHQADAKKTLMDAGETVADEVDIKRETSTDDQPANMATVDNGTTAAVSGTPVEIVDEVDGELIVNFPLLVLEGVPTGDGRLIDAGGLTARGLPLTLLAQAKKEHGGEKPPAAVTVGRIDTLERVPGPEVISGITGEPFPEGSFVWRGTGAISTNAMIDDINVADYVQRRFLRGVSADLLPIDYTITDDGGIIHKGQIGGATIVPVPAFGECFVELPGTASPADPPQLPTAVTASAFPAWRAAGIDFAAADNTHGSVTIVVPSDAATQLVQVIDDGTGQQRDAGELASAIVDFMTSTWDASADSSGDSADDPATPPVAESRTSAADGKKKPPPFPPKKGGAMAVDPATVDPEIAGDVADAARPNPGDDPDDTMGTGMPDKPQPCPFPAGEMDHPATHSLLFGDDEMSYVPACEDHDTDAQNAITAEGYEVTGVVQIDDGDGQDAAEEDAA